MNDKSTAQAEFEKSAKIERNVVYEGKTISLRNEVLMDGGKPVRKWDIVAHPGAVVVVPVTDEGKIILVKQWRRAVQEILLELPAGTLEKAEPPELCAQRELQEETGFKAEEIISLGGFYSAPGFCTEYLHLFLAKGLVESALEADCDEAIDLIFVSIDQAWTMIANRQIHDAKTIAGVARYEKWAHH
ncbi:MAG: NUDIX hydrolase [Verrucomicrobia bacterium]|nr:NUDIX hydrolase [Verrucomicrobiota bacterium]